MSIMLLLSILRRAEDPIADLIMSAILAVVLVLFFLWSRARRRLAQRRARGWPSMQGNFEDGEVVTMRKGRSEDIAGYEVWLYYRFGSSDDENGLYTLPVRGEYPDTETAESVLRMLVGKAVMVHVSPRNPKRSCVLDKDVAALLQASGS